MRRVAFIFLMVLILAAPASAGRIEDVKSACDAVQGYVLHDWKFQFPARPGGEKVGLDDSSWQTVDIDHKWDGDNNQAWFRKTVVLPEDMGGFPVKGRTIVLKVGMDDDGDIYVNGEKRASFHWDEGRIVLAEKAEPGQRFQVAIYGKNNGAPGRLLFARLEMDPAPPVASDFMDYVRKAEMASRFAPHLDSRAVEAVNASLNAVDLDAARSGNSQKLAASLELANDALAPLGPEMKKLRCHLVGNAHIDMAWLWPWEETVDVCRDTFTSVLKLMDEFPQFTYSQSQAQAYLWMEERYPEIFKQIQQRVKEGRWEIVGGMWVEPDCNLPSGESLVRQILYGKRYFMEKFGADVKVGWNPDSFGYAWSLPQIYKKAGIDCFVTNKLGWNEDTRFPYNIFRWRGPDGTEILGHQTFGSYGESVSADAVLDQQARAKEEHNVDDMMVLYGVGDHGGGPSRAMIERGVEFEKAPMFPTIVWSRADRWYNAVMPKWKTFPVYDSELYLQTHRGTYTTQAKNKKNNRRSEFAMFCSEEISSLAKLEGASYPDGFTPIWRKVLFNQFHDILPGSSIHRVYEESAKDYAEIFDFTGKTIDLGISTLAAEADTTGRGTPLLVFNPLSWSRSGLVTADVSGPVIVTDPSGVVVPSQIVDGGKKVVFVAENVPSVGYKVYHLVSGRLKGPGTTVSADGNVIQNRFFRVEIDAVTGNVARIYDKVNRREVLAGQGNQFLTYEDTPRAFDAWNVDADDMSRPTPVNGLESIKVVENGPVKSAVRITRSFGKSKIEQDVVLYSDISRIDFPTHVSWHESHTMLKVAFPLAVESDHVTYEIPYAAIERPTVPKTKEEKAKFEVSAHKWADMSERDYGVSLLNDCKYGYSVDGNLLRLSLLRSPKSPDPQADMGDHEFTYSLYPHAHGWQDGGTVHAGYDLNQPLIVRSETAHEGSLPSEHSFLTLSASNVVVGAFKKAEDSDAVILRLYESAGRKSRVTIGLPAVPKRAAETDLMEHETGKVRTEGSNLFTTFGPYEIKTFKLVF